MGRPWRRRTAPPAGRPGQREAGGVALVAAAVVVAVCGCTAGPGAGSAVPAPTPLPATAPASTRPVTARPASGPAARHTQEITAPVTAPGGVGGPVVVTGAGDVVELSPAGAPVRSFGRVGGTVSNHADAVDVSPDGARLVVSTLDDSDGRCTAHTLSTSVTARGGSLRRWFDGASATLSPDGARVAYVRYRLVDGFCSRVAVVVRDIATGREVSRPLPGGPRLPGTPPGWPVSFAPDGTRLALVVGLRTVVLPVGASTGASAETSAGGLVGAPVRTVGPDGEAYAPVFLSDGRLAVMGGCCMGGNQPVGAVDGAGARTVLFSAPAPVRSIRRDRTGPGLYLTVEDGGLLHWDGTRLAVVTRDALVTSG